jgi:NhaP-type Na+/H+ or K+/H+ antiporter
MNLLAVFIALIFFYSLVSRRLERTILTAPILFTLAGMAASLLLPELREGPDALALLLHVAEIGLVLLLFSDASRIDLRILQSFRSLPVRLLSTGMLLTIVLGTVGALVVFRQLSLWEACILAAILAPTDAGLGQIIVNSRRVPLKIRQALNVEAGLNDGLSVPFLLFFIALAGGAAGGGHSSLLRFIVEQLGYGTLVGVGIGALGGWLLGAAHKRKWLAHSWQQLGVVALPILCMEACEPLGASMFIAAFIGGLAVQVRFKEAGKHSVEFAEGWGQLFNLSDFTLAHALYAILSLTVIRMAPVALALSGTRLSRASVVFMGWFGPRGLASIVLGLVYLEKQTHHPGESTIELAVMMTVLLSVFAHGLSALPGIGIYARKIQSLGPDAPELEA